MLHVRDAHRLPNLPGNSAYIFDAAARRSLNQSLKYVAGYAVVDDGARNKGRPCSAQAVQRAREAPFAYDGDDAETGVHVGTRRSEASHTPYKAQPPAWIVFDRKVLRFDAYFKEAVHDSPLEHWRVRRCRILHYLEDGSTQVEEPKESNSGLYQGTLLKRHRILLGDGQLLRYSDLAVGSAINLYNKVLYIYACDAFTRDFMRQQGYPQAPDQAAPVDPYHHRAQEKENLARDTKPSAPVEEKPPNTMQYLDNSRKVLRFWACWDDRKSVHGERMPFVIHFFLADDTMEVREVHMRNNGRDPFPVFVRRMKVPKKVHQVGVRPMSPNTRKRIGIEYYKWTDLAVGKTINVYGRDMLLTSADDFTREYYKRRAGATDADFQPIEVDYHKKVARPVIDAPQPWMNLGRDEDTIGNVKHLIPKQPKPDLEKSELYGNQALRFIARFAEAPGYPACGPADRERVFILSFFLATDEIFVFEPPIRNAGILGGKFLERTRMHVPGTRRYYAATDLFVGALIPLVSRLFELIEADDWTLEFMEARPHEFPWASFDGVLARLRKEVQDARREEALRTALMDGDLSGTGLIAPSVFQKLLARLGMEFSLHEVITLSRGLGRGGSGIASDALLDALALQERSDGRLPPPPPGRQSVGPSEANLDFAMQQMQQREGPTSVVAPPSRRADHCW